MMSNLLLLLFYPILLDLLFYNYDEQFITITIIIISIMTY